VVRVRPLISLEAGEAVFQPRLTVREVPRRPLRAHPETPSVVLHQLSSPSVLVALIALGADRATSVAVAADLCERWGVVIGRGEGRRCNVALQPAPLERPIIAPLRADTLRRSRRWRELRSELATCEFLSGLVGGWRRGFSFDIGSFPFRPAAPDDRLVPHLALYDDLADLTPEQQAEELATLARLMDEGMARAAGLQALVARWDWRPGSGLIGATPYEAACDISGDFSFLNGQAWCQRYLRGVAERLWLGPDLLARLGGIAPLQQVADVAPVGAAVRVTLRPTSSLAELEQALAPLLPSRQDWEALGQR
jgi:hypothetical protein